MKTFCKRQLEDIYDFLKKSKSPYRYRTDAGIYTIKSADDVELEIEKVLGLDGKKDIEKLRAVLSVATDEDIKKFMENASRLKNLPPMG